MGAVVADFDPGGDRSESVREFFQGGDPGSVVVRGGELGTDPKVDQTLSSFQHRVARQITGRQPRRREYGS